MQRADRRDDEIHARATIMSLGHGWPTTFVMADASALKEKLTSELDATYVVRSCCISYTLRLIDLDKPQEVKDTSGGCGGQKFEVVIVSAQFEGKRLLERHRLVHQCLAKELESIHAFSQKTYTPEQWEKMSEQ